MDYYFGSNLQFCKKRLAHNVVPQVNVKNIVSKARSYRFQF